MYIVADFVKLTSISEYRSLILEKVKDLDIGILAANAGSMAPGLYDELTDNEIEISINLNCLHVAYIIKALTNKFEERG